MVKIIVGMMGSSVGGGSRSLASPTQVQDFLDCVKRHNVKELDTARVYAGGKSEELLGAVNAGSQFAVSTKAPAFAPGSLTEANIISNYEKSLAALRQDKVDICMCVSILHRFSVRNIRISRNIFHYSLHAH